MTSRPGTAEDKARFEAIVTKTLINEGGLYDDPNTGEYSKYGISLAFLKGLRPAATKADIFELTTCGAKSLYFAHFWSSPEIWRLDSDALAFRVFDLSVNCGAGVAIRLLQRAINACDDLPVRVDGRLGEITASISNGLDQVRLLEELKAQARARYKLIAQTNPAHKNDLSGWLARLEKA